MPYRGGVCFSPVIQGTEIIKLSLPSAGTGAALIVWKTLPGYAQPEGVNDVYSPRGTVFLLHQGTPIITCHPITKEHPAQEMFSKDPGDGGS